MGPNLQVFSIFDSISGEVGGVPQGIPTRFLRLSGCNAYCTYCDAKEALTSGTWMDNGELVRKLSTYDRPPHLLITGGEPLLQQESLMNLLNQISFSKVSIETNGTLMPSYFLESLVNYFVIDIKCPSAQSKVKGLSTDFLKGICKRYDEIWFKAVVQTKDDLEYAKNKFKKIVRQNMNGKFALSPCGKITAADLYSHIKNDDFLWKNVILNVQIHKYIWEVEGGDKLIR